MTEALEAHFRLCEQLTRRTHEWSPPEARQPVCRKIKHPGVGRGKNQRGAIPVRIKGRLYGCLAEAAKALHLSPKTIRKMIDEGKAQRCITRR